MDEKRVVLFGIGALSKFLSYHVRKETKIVAYLTNGADTDKVDGIPLLSSLDELKNIEYDYIIVAFGDTPKGISILEKAGVADEKIVGYAYSGFSYEENLLQKRCNEYIHESLRNEKISDLFDVPEKKYYLCGMNVQENQNVIRRDFVREQTLSFLAEEIYRRDIVGAVAEIGVSSGDFAWKINKLFPDRKLYLFDTYNGLSIKDKEHAIELGWGEKWYALVETGTPEEEVLKIMPHRKNCIVKRGYFPDTFDLDEKLALVSLDIDFYNSINEGLKLIYSHLSEGGYIMVHDFHNLSYTESRDAIIDFCDKNKIAYVPIPDIGGTVIIAK